MTRDVARIFVQDGPLKGFQYDRDFSEVLTSFYPPFLPPKVMTSEDKQQCVIRLVINNILFFLFFCWNLVNFLAAGLLVMHKSFGYSMTELTVIGN